MSRTEINNYRIVGEVNKPLFKIPFKKEIRAISLEDAIEKVYSEVGSKHKAKRFEIKIITKEERKKE